jgi:hypothetical protein
MEEFTDKNRQLFLEIEADIKENPDKYLQAGKWLNQFYNEDKFWQKKKEYLETLIDIGKSHETTSRYECEFCEEAEWLRWVIEKRTFTSHDEYIEISDMEQAFREGLLKKGVPAIYRLLEAKNELVSQYSSNCGMLSEHDAKCIYLTNWLLTSPESRNDTEIEITKFQHYELTELEGIIYSRMGLAFSTQRDIEEWIKMIKAAQHRLDFEKQNKAKPEAETPAEKEQDALAAAKADLKPLLKNVETQANNRKTGKAGDKTQATPAPAIEKAYQSYQYAIEKNPDFAGKKDKEVHTWLKNNGIDDYTLPAFETWQRYVRKGRKHYGTSKNTPRAGRTGRSIITSQ